MPRRAVMGLEKLATLGFGRPCFEPEHDAFRETARRFFKDKIDPNVKQWEKDGFYPASVFKEAAKAGLLCAGMPAEYGGGGGDIKHHIVMHEEHGYNPGGTSLEAGLGTDASTYILYHGGTEDQKKKWLPFFASGDGIAELGLSEPDTG